MITGEFLIDSADLPFHGTLSGLEAAQVQFVPVTITTGILSSYFWATAADLDALDDAIRDDPGITTATRVDRFEGNALYTSTGLPAHGLFSEMTPLEEETLLAAVQDGYFTVPRQVSIADLAASLGRSPEDVATTLEAGLGSILDQAVVRPAAY